MAETNEGARLRAKLIQIRNVVGVRELDIQPGRLTVVSGHNEAGKTSTISAIKALFQGGSDATLLRHGATKGEVVLVLDDDTTIKRRIGPGGKVTVTGPDGVERKAPQTWLDSVANFDSVNPIAFVEAPAKDRVGMLLRAVRGGLPDEAARLAQKVGIDTSEPPVAVLDALHRSTYEERTGLNRLLRDKRGMVEELRRTLPPAAVQEPEDEDAIQAEARRLASDLEAARAELRRVAKEATDAIAAESSPAVEGAQAQLATIDAEIADLRQRLSVAEARRKEVAASIGALVASSNEDCLARTRAIGAQLAKDLATVDTEARTRQGSIDLRLQAVRLSRDARQRAEQQRAALARAEAEADRVDGEVLGLTGRLDQVRKWREDLIRTFPVPGLDVADGNVVVNGTAFDRLCGAEQWQVAVQVAAATAGKLGLVLADGLEALDATHFEQFAAAVRAAGLQAIVTRVTDGALSVQAIE